MVKHMTGNHSVELQLPPVYSQLHPVFNVSLLMMYLGPDVVTPDHGQHPQNDFPQHFVDWASMTFVVDYRCLQPGLHEYLIQRNDISGLNDG